MEKREALELTKREELSLKYGQRAHAISMGLGLMSLAIVVTTGLAGLGGFLYMLMGPLHAWNGYQAGKAHSEFDKRTQGT